MFLIFFFIVVHAVGNLHVFKGPDDFNGYGYFYVRLYWTGIGLQANIVEEYVLLSAFVAHLRGFEANVGSEVVFWVDERPAELGHHGLDVAQIHDHSPLPVPLCRY